MQRLLCLLALLTCGSLTAAPIKIGVLAPLTGHEDWWGKPYRDSILLAYQELGLTPDKVELVFEDWQSDWPRLALATQKLVNIDKVDAIINTFDKAAYICAPILKPKNIPQLVLALDDRPADGKVTFTVWTPIRTTTQMLLDEAVSKGHKRLALFILKDYYPYRAELEIKAQLKNYPGLEIVDTQYFDPSQREFRMTSLKAREKQWDLAVILAYPPTAPILTRQLIADGVKNLTSIETFDQFNPEELALLPAGTWWTSSADPRPEFTAAFQKRFGYVPFVGPIYGYDCLKLLVKAFELDRAHPAAALHNLSVQGAGGTTTLTPPGWANMPAYLKRWDGKQKTVVPTP